MVSIFCSIVSAFSQEIRLRDCGLPVKEITLCFCAYPLEYSVSLYSLIGGPAGFSLASRSMVFCVDSWTSFFVDLSSKQISSFFFERCNTLNFAKASPSVPIFLEWLSFSHLIRFSQRSIVRLGTRTNEKHLSGS